MDLRMVEALVDLFVFVATLLHMPSRQTVFDLSIWPRVLLEYDNDRPAFSQYARYFGPRCRGSDYRHDMSRFVGNAFTHNSITLHARRRMVLLRLSVARSTMPNC
jgi:hypothetical protein